MKWFFSLSLIAAAFTASARADDDRYDRFALWNDCLPIQPLALIGKPPDENDAAEIGLTDDAALNAVSIRLQSAGLFAYTIASDHHSVLLVEIDVFRLAFVATVSYMKHVKDLTSGETGFAVTWSYGSFGQHGGDPGYVLSSVSRHVDTFVEGYLRVNADACGS